MTTYENVLVPVLLPRDTDAVLLAVAAYLARYKGQSRVHTESDLRSFLTWCRERDLDPLAAQRPNVPGGITHPRPHTPAVRGP